ncbi:hypothetical protein C1H46_012311 [Malus baccata]|uniref:Uncharacterized protein n=1 Tax=Malus baccata TaxID=106549 RepID=A0A540MV20_MALBA|nr:hypothetical protein C1H46_012311 [Malus baccata]
MRPIPVIKEALAFAKVGLETTGQSSFSRFVRTCHIQSLPQRSSELEAQIPDIKEASALSRRVSICQIAHLRCVNHAQSVEDF